MFEQRCNSYLRNAKLCHAVSVFFSLFTVLIIFNSDAYNAVVGNSGYVEIRTLIQSMCYCSIALIINYIIFNNSFNNDQLVCIPTIDELVRCFIIATIATSLVLFIIDSIVSHQIFSPLAVVSYLVVGTAFHSFLINTSYLTIKKFNSSKKNRRIVLMVGSNRHAVEMARFFEENQILGFYNLGFVDDENHSDGEARLLSTLDKFEDVIRNNVIDFIFIHLPIRSYYDSISTIIEKAECQGIAVHYLSNIFEPRKSKLEASRVGSVHSIVLHTAPTEDWRIRTKRVIDVIMAIIGIIVTLPIMAISALIIKITDRGPIIFKQKRVGYNKRIFNVYKLRTMCVGAERMKTDVDHLNEMDGPVFKIKCDPRITRFGRFLRKYSIDELPQFFNVLQGDMSIVGPRAMALTDYQGFSEDWQRRRFSMRPGLTCYWQIRGRNKLPFNEWMRLDMEYIDNWNLLEDFKIMLLTIPEIFRGGGI
ncbi:sugar transferase [Fundidesulfovibrio soli]|uniref:sugar transferase n=1 Tax=Fundidesulfovibrio soli TaxID=2922716 RepID=UPI001FAE76ED|nr:sugar transferase [Fundidesulfovibrio soli]